MGLAGLQKTTRALCLCTKTLRPSPRVGEWLLPHFDMELISLLKRMYHGAKANDSKNVKSHAYPLFRTANNSIYVSAINIYQGTCLQKYIHKLEMTF